MIIGHIDHLIIQQILRNHTGVIVLSPEEINNVSMNIRDYERIVYEPLYIKQPDILEPGRKRDGTSINRRFYIHLLNMGEEVLLFIFGLTVFKQIVLIFNGYGCTSITRKYPSIDKHNKVGIMNTIVKSIIGSLHILSL